MKIRSILTLAAALLAASIAPAQDLFGKGLWAGADTGTTLASVIISPQAGEKPVLTYINATSDKAASVLQFYTGGTRIAPAAAASGQADVDVPDGSAFSGGNIVILHDRDGDQLQRLVVDSVADDTVTFTANLSFALTANDSLYIMTAGASIPVGAATKEVSAAPGAIVAGSESGPFLVDLDGTSACAINAASGIYYEEP